MYRKRSQSALEYMMTYGWAILIIVIVAAVLYSMGIFSPSSSVSATITGFSGLGSVTAQCYANGVLRIQLGNSIGNTINITKITATNTKTGASSSFSGNSTVDPNPEISPDGAYIFSIPNVCLSAGSRFSMSVGVNYTEPGQIFPGPYYSSGFVFGTVSSAELPPFVASYSDGANSETIGGYSAPSQLTISFWTFMPSLVPVESNAWEGIIGNSGGVTGCCEWRIGPVNSDGKLLFDTGWHDDMGTSEKFPTGVWNNVIMTVENSGLATVYSLLLNNANISYGNASGSTITAVSNIYFGSAPGTGYYNGLITNVQIYSTALSSAQATQLYSEGIMGKPLNGPTLIGWWPLNATIKGWFKDYSGGLNNASEVLTTSNYQAP